MASLRSKHARTDSLAGSLKDALFSYPLSRASSVRSSTSTRSSLSSASDRLPPRAHTPEIRVSIASPRSSLEPPVRYVHPHFAAAAFRPVHSMSTPDLVSLSPAVPSPYADPFANEGDSYFVETPPAHLRDVEDVSTWDNFLLSVSAGVQVSPKAIFIITTAMHPTPSNVCPTPRRKRAASLPQRAQRTAMT
jgi:hypothetical protein